MLSNPSMSALSQYEAADPLAGKLANITVLLSHELVKARSDTVLGTGILCDSEHVQNRELCDVCSGPAGVGKQVYCGTNASPIGHNAIRRASYLTHPCQTFI